MSRDKNKPFNKKPIEEKISALASSSASSSAESLNANQQEARYLEDEQKEKFYLDLVRQEIGLTQTRNQYKNSFWNFFFNLFQKRSDVDDLDQKKNISPAEFLIYLESRRAWQSFKEDEEKHNFRKLFLKALFLLTCAWLATVVYFVYQNAVSPSVDDRGKLIQIQVQLETISKATTNTLDSAMIHAANPEYRSILFHLSDSVLIAFITSTTVAVLGLFLTAANWLYGKPIEKKSTDANSNKKNE